MSGSDNTALPWQGQGYILYCRAAIMFIVGIWLAINNTSLANVQSIFTRLDPRCEQN